MRQPWRRGGGVGSALLQAAALFLFSVVITYVVWAVHWELWIVGGTGMSESVRSSQLYLGQAEGFFNEETMRAAGLPEALEEVARREQAAVVGVSPAFGWHESVVVDPVNVLEWLPDDVEPHVAYPLEGSYLDQAGCARVREWMLPEGYECGEAIARPDLLAGSSAQFVRMWDSEIPVSFGYYRVLGGTTATAERVGAVLEEYLPVYVEMSSQAEVIDFLVYDTATSAGWVVGGGAMVLIVLFFFVRHQSRRHVARVAWHSGVRPFRVLAGDVMRHSGRAAVACAAGAGAASMVSFLASLGEAAVSPLSVFAWGLCMSWLCAGVLNLGAGMLIARRWARRWDYA